MGIFADRDNSKGTKYASTARKLANLDKFMNANVDAQTKVRTASPDKEAS